MLKSLLKSVEQLRYCLDAIGFSIGGAKSVAAHSTECKYDTQGIPRYPQIVLKSLLKSVGQLRYCLDAIGFSTCGAKSVAACARGRLVHKRQVIPSFC
jgi:hypothetical protein